MGCSRCGRSRPAPRSNPPSGAGRPGSSSWNPSKQGTNPNSNSGRVRDAISGLKYVPNK